MSNISATTADVDPQLPTAEHGVSTTTAAGAQKHPPTRRGVIVDLMVESADRFVDFISKAAGAKEYFRHVCDNGKALHIALDIGGVAVYVEELGNDMDVGEVNTPHVRLHVNCNDPVGMAASLMKAGAKELIKCEKQFWGARFGQCMDPFGVIWSVCDSANVIQDVPQELSRTIAPYMCVRDAADYVAFLKDVFAAETLHPPSKDPSGKIMCAEIKLNGGILLIADHCEDETDKTKPSITVSHEVPKGRAAELSDAFEANGGQTLERPTMQFWKRVWGRSKDPFGQMWALTEPQVGPVPSDEELAVDIELCAKFNWKYAWAVEEVPVMHCFGEVHSWPAKGPSIAQEMKSMLPAAFAGAAKAGLVPSGPPLAMYFTWESREDGKTTFTTGPSVAGGGPAPGGDGLGVRKAGGGKMVTVMHVGPYEGLMATYKATFEWIAAKGYESTMPVVEIYENDPKVVEPEKLRTKICVSIAAK